MVRARNEEEFLYPSVKSIVDHVEEVVIVDNGSTDATPQVIDRLCAEHPDKIAKHHYPHTVRRVGRENWELAEAPETRSSPRLSANFYNWCLERCSGTHVVKWDADMIAAPLFHRELARWRASTQEVMVFFGANVHPDRRHLIRARETEPEALLARLQFRAMPDWVAWLTYDYPEPRLFPREDAVYVSVPWTQTLETPHLEGDGRYEVEAACYLHVKFCKREPLSNYTDDLADLIAGNIDVGPPLEPAWLDELRRWGLLDGDRREVGLPCESSS